MSMPPIEVREVNGFTVAVHYDDHPEAHNPRRDVAGNSLWLGFPHRSYVIGDEQINPETFEAECVICHGSGRVDVIEANAEFPCAVCNGYGTESAGNLTELIALVKRHYKARIVQPVGMYDHSGVSFYLGADNPCRWDSGTCGLILVTQDMLDEWGCTQTDEELIEGMKAEIGYYSAWSQGEVYYYAVTDCNGDEVDSCGGYIGDDGLKEAMAEGASMAEALTPPEPTYVVPRLTAHQLSAAAYGLIMYGHDEVAATLLAPIIVKEPS